MIIHLLIILYVFLLVSGFKSTWKYVSDLVLAGSIDILFSVLLFILLFLIIGPIFGVINWGKLGIKKMKNRA